MATKRVIDIAIEGKADGAKKAMKETGDEAEGLGSKLGSLGKSFGSMATIAGGVFAGGILAKAPGIVGGLSSSFKDLELQAKKTSTVFGADLTGDLNDWANEVAASMGLTTMQAKNAATDNFAKVDVRQHALHLGQHGLRFGCQLHVAAHSHQQRIINAFRKRTFFRQQLRWQLLGWLVDAFRFRQWFFDGWQLQLRLIVDAHGIRRQFLR